MMISGKILRIKKREYDKLKKHLHETKGQDLKIDKYLFLIETKYSKIVDQW